MIESVFSNENGEPNRPGRAQATFKIPKNIRQVGRSSSYKKIYIEDYVMTFIKQLAGEDYSKYRAAVLVGQYVKIENSRCIFISGALAVEGLDFTEGICFTNDVWNTIYDDIKKYFVDEEIVGWFLGAPGYLLEDTEVILKAHIDNFAGQDKTLLTYDNMEKEETFYLYVNGKLSKQEGYYIYYEKNEPMQSYMIDLGKSGNTELGYDDHVSREIRTIIQNKKPSSDAAKGTTRLMYAAGTLLAVVILVVGAAILNNYDQMKTMRAALDSLARNITEMENRLSKNNNKEASVLNQKETGTQTANIDELTSLDVEVLPGNVTPLEQTANPGADPAGGNTTGSQTNNSQTGSGGTGNERTDTGGTESARTQDNEDNGGISTTSNGSSDREASGANEEEVKYYTVVAGDSLAGISYKLYNSPNYISVIKELNNIEDENMIYIGQKLKLP